MSFLCPACGAPGGLRIRLSLELPPDARSDETTVQSVACDQCGFQGAAVYEESRRGALDSEAWNHTGYRLPRSEALRLAALLQQCPQPGKPSCGCLTHQALGGQDAHGRWLGLAGFEIEGEFPMRPAGSN